MPPLRRLVLDVLKPHDPPLLVFTRQVGESPSVEAITGSLIELDQAVQNVKLTIEGSAIDYDALADAIEHLGATIHSVDEVTCGDYIVEDRPTHQDL